MPASAEPTAKVKAVSYTHLRIGKVTGRAANMLGLKPMILFKDGEIFSGGVARGRQKSFEKALEQLMNYLDAHGGTPDDYRITVGYGYEMCIRDRVPEGRHVFLHMTVDENLDMGAYTPVSYTHLWTVCELRI